MSKDPTQPDSLKLSIPNSAIYIGLICTAVVVITAAIVAASSSLDLEFRDYLTIFTCGVICTTLVYHSKNVVLTYRYHQERLALDREKMEADMIKYEKEVERKKIEMAFQVSNDWFKTLSDCVQRSRAFINKNRNNGRLGSVHQFISLIDSNPDDRKALISILNYFEFIALLIKSDMVHEETAKNFFKTVFVEYYGVLKPYIDERQKSSRRYLINYEELASKWSKN